MITGPIYLIIYKHNVGSHRVGLSSKWVGPGEHTTTQATGLMCLLLTVSGDPILFDQRYRDWPTVYHMFFSELLGLAYTLQRELPFSLDSLMPPLTWPWLYEPNVRERNVDQSKKRCTLNRRKGKPYCRWCSITKRVAALREVTPSLL
jgi:hypothetical protein